VLAVACGDSDAAQGVIESLGHYFVYDYLIAFARSVLILPQSLCRCATTGSRTTEFPGERRSNEVVLISPPLSGA
jgi:hypothetical protein